MEQNYPANIKSAQNLICEIIANFDNKNKNMQQVKTYCGLYKSVLKNKINVVENAFGIDGLYYIENYLTDNEIDYIMNMINNLQFENIYSAKSRRVAHYGYYYSYDRSGLKPAPAIPTDFGMLMCPERINAILDKKLLDSKFNQLIINEYKPGQQIAPHTDHTTQFGPIVACVTIGQAVPINFTDGQTNISANIKAASLYIMTGDSRYKYRHSLKNTGSDNRYSLTYRTINL